MSTKEITLTINGEPQTITIDPSTPLLWALRENLGMTGTKFGCGMAQCGACTVVIDGVATRSCVMPVQFVYGKNIETIEGLAEEHPIKQAWVDNDVPQCGYCQPGQIMNALGLLNGNPSPNREEIADGMAGNICRCGTYPKIIDAVEQASTQFKKA